MAEVRAYKRAQKMKKDILTIDELREKRVKMPGALCI